LEADGVFKYFVNYFVFAACQFGFEVFYVNFAVSLSSLQRQSSKFAVLPLLAVLLEMDIPDLFST